MVECESIARNTSGEKRKNTRFGILLESSRGNGIPVGKESEEGGRERERARKNEILVESRETLRINL